LLGKINDPRERVVMERELAVAVAREDAALVVAARDDGLVDAERVAKLDPRARAVVVRYDEPDDVRVRDTLEVISMPASRSSCMYLETSPRSAEAPAT
jgi:hypothetical protein